MATYIELKNGTPINFPFEDFNKDPATVDCAPFIRQPIPYHLDRKPLQVFDSKYVLAEDSTSYTDSWYIREMTANEAVQETKFKKEGVTSSVESLIDVATNQLATADINDSPIWKSYLENLINIDLTDPFAVKVPKMPIKDKLGNWVSIDNMGSTPDVIG